MAQLKYSSLIQVARGGSLTISPPPFDAEIVERVDFTLDPAPSEYLVQLQPGTAEAIKLLAITASDYGDHTHFVTYVAQAGGLDGQHVELRAPHVFTEGNVVLLGQPPQQLTFTNPNIASKVDIQVFVARSAH